MNIIRITLIGLVCTWFLTSCVTMPSAEQSPQNQRVPWKIRAQKLSSIQHWDLQGLIAIHAAANNESWSAHWQWEQAKKGYTISLVGPLGSGAIKLTGGPEIVTLDTSDGKHFQAQSAETLLAQQLGWRLPVSNLYYWVRGLPVPGMPAAKQFDVYNHLTQLRQSDWVIQYLRYTSIDQTDVPSKIYLTNPALSVKIIINQWQI